MGIGATTILTPGTSRTSASPRRPRGGVPGCRAGRRSGVSRPTRRSNRPPAHRSAVRRSPRSRRCRPRWPAHSRHAAVGPFSTRPATSGLTATTGAGLATIASRTPGTARIGPIEMTGFDGPITIARARSIASSTSAVGRAARAWRNSTSSHRTGAAVADHELLQRPPAPGGEHRRPDRLVGHRQHGGRDPERGGEPRLGCRLALALTEHPSPLQADREITVTEVEPDVDAELPQLIHRVEAVGCQAPAALVDPVGQPERDEVRVGGDVGAVDLDVVAGVGDHDEPLTDDVEHPAGELGAAGAAGQDHDGMVGAHRPSSVYGRRWEYDVRA